MVTTGPGRIWSIWPFTPNSASTLSSRRAFWRRAAASTSDERGLDLASIASSGSWKPASSSKSKAFCCSRRLATRFLGYGLGFGDRHRAGVQRVLEGVLVVLRGSGCRRAPSRAATPGSAQRRPRPASSSAVDRRQAARPLALGRGLGLFPLGAGRLGGWLGHRFRLGADPRLQGVADGGVDGVGNQPRARQWRSPGRRWPRRRTGWRRRSSRRECGRSAGLRPPCAAGRRPRSRPGPSPAARSPAAAEPRGVAESASRPRAPTRARWRRSLRSASGSAWATRVTPKTSMNRATPQPDRPNDCISRSAIAAPGAPRGVAGPAHRWAAFRLGSVAL